MKVASQKTVFITASANSNGYTELLTLDGTSLGPSSGDSMMTLGTRIAIDGTVYVMAGSSIEVTSGETGASVVTTVALSKL